ncbi:hypothetical protein AO354_48325 [Pseudomonas syringae pv. syringae]|nr:hypothetical protein AO354_48325 [Pseudomonas syringae pv. syringae]
MPKSIVSNLDHLLLRISNVGIRCGFLLIVGYVLLSMMSTMVDPTFDPSPLAQELAPLIVYAIGLSTVCMLLQMMIRSSASSN